MNPDKSLKNQRLLSFCVQMRTMEANPWWGYFWGYIFRDWGHFVPPISEAHQMALTDTEIRRSKPAEKPYKLSDSGGLYLLVTPSGGRLWRWKYRFQGVEKSCARHRFGFLLQGDNPGPAKITPRLPSWSPLV
jgi:hypothetical protein